jgi:hypothetical protein
MSGGAPAPRPGQDERHGRRRSASRTGLIIGLVAAAVAAVGVVIGVVIASGDDGGTRPYQLTVPATAAGFPLDPDGTKDLAADHAAAGNDAGYKARVKAALGGTAGGDMFAVYTDAADGLKISIHGMTGTGFVPHKHETGLERLNREAGNPLPFQSVDPGPNGGSAECTTFTGGGVGCSWLTSTTFVIVEFRATDHTGKPPLDRAVELLHVVRSAVEKPV